MFHSPDSLTGFPTLYRNAWNYCLDCQCTCASDGWGLCTFQSTSSVSYNKCSDWLISTYENWCWYEQGDKARVIQSLLFMSGVNTLLQTLFGTRLPTVMGPSAAFTLPVLSIINDYSDTTFTSEHEVWKVPMKIQLKSGKNKIDRLLICKVRVLIFCIKDMCGGVETLVQINLFVMKLESFIFQ